MGVASLASDEPAMRQMPSMEVRPGNEVDAVLVSSLTEI